MKENTQQKNGVAILSGRAVRLWKRERGETVQSKVYRHYNLERERERRASDMEAATRTLRKYMPTRQRNEKTTKLEDANIEHDGIKRRRREEKC